MANPRNLGSYFRAISNTLSQRMQENSEKLGLTAAQGMFLHHLWYREHILKEPTHAKELETFFEIKHPTVSGILQRMENAGFVTFAANETDRRCKTIHLTPLAEAAHEETECCIRQIETVLTDGMTEDETAQLRCLLDKAANNLGVFCRHPAVSLSKEERAL